MAAPESRVIFIEGIYALSQRIESLFDLKIAITGGVHFDLVKRVRLCHLIGTMHHGIGTQPSVL